MFCIRCGTENADGTRFCTHCGEPLDDGGPQRQPASGLCPSCHLPLVEGASFCTNCGAPVKGGTAASMPAVASPAQNPYVPGQRLPRSSRVGNDQSRRLIAAFLVALVIVGVGLAAFMTNGFGLLKPAESPTVQAPSSPSAASSSSASSVAATTGDVAVQTSLSSYSWDDLSKIAKKIEKAGSADAAKKVAEQYNILNGDGSVSTSTKQLKCSDGTTANVRVAGVYHDDLADGSGKAGITFMTSQIFATHAMNGVESNSGGWQGCSMRTWLASSVLPTLPSDLQGVIVPVSKLTNNVGKTTSTSSVTKTSDKLWLLSEREVAGTVSWTWDSDPTNSSLYNAVINAEGAQYQVFSSKSINNEEANASLVLTDSSGSAVAWCLRSPSPSVSGHFRHVSTEGDPSSTGYENLDPYGVVFGFCL